jgi:phosphoenolpyruvate-protein kinase (PTS system EI component)
MVTDIAEITAVRAMVDRCSKELGIDSRIRLGAMIETPAAALTASCLLREVDFLSIGSNDLTQYTLAMDRGHTELAQRTDALHPAVLKLIALAASAGEDAGKTVAVCGAAAADRLAVPVLIGLGIRELSVVPAAIPPSNARFARFASRIAARSRTAACRRRPRRKSVPWRRHRSPIRGGHEVTILGISATGPGADAADCRTADRRVAAASGAARPPGMECNGSGR